MIDNKRIISNAVALYIRMIIIMAINFLMARVVLDVLGVTDYGIYNLVCTIIIVFSFLKSSLSEATQRFLNYSMGYENVSQLNKIFITCMNCYYILITITIILGETFWLLYGHTLNLPPERYDAATFAFQVALITFVISVLQVPYNAVIIADEKMGVFAKISIIEAFLKLALTFIISYIIADKLKLYSLLMLLNSFIILFIYRTYCKKRITYTKYKFVWDPLLFKRILSFTGWNMLGALAGVLSESGVSLIFNNFCGVIINASIGLSNQVNNALSNFTTGFQTAFKPQITKSYAAKQINDFYKLICRSSKLSFYLFFLISIPIILNIEYIFNLWLVDVPEYACDFCKIILLGSLIDSLSGIFYSSIGSTGHIKYYQISITSVFILHIILTWGLLNLGMECEYVFFSRLLTRGFLNFIIGLYFLKKLTGMKYSEYLHRTLIPVFRSVLIPIIAIIYFIHIVENNTISNVALNIIVFELLSIVSIIKFGLSRNEIIKLKKIIRKK